MANFVGVSSIGSPKSAINTSPSKKQLFQEGRFPTYFTKARAGSTALDK
jgi:hypothetical protein